MSNRVDLFLEYADETEVHFIEYLKTRSLDGKSKVVLVLEGKDDPKFYTPKFDALVKKDWELLSIGGKSKSIKLRDKIRAHPRYGNDLVYFFIDRDYDKDIVYADTYVTPTYSIENLYCSPTTVKRLIEAECGLTKVSLKYRREIIDFLLAEYEILRSGFHENKKTHILNSIYCFIRNRRKDETICLDKVLKLSVNLVESKLSIRLTRGAAFKIYRVRDKEEYREFVLNDARWFEVSGNPPERFRGKQEIQILRIYVNALKNEGPIAKKVHERFGIKVKADNPAMADHILSTASQYVQTPSCLSSFLSSI